MHEIRFGRLASVRVGALSLLTAAVLVACSAGGTGTGTGPGTNPPRDTDPQVAEPYVMKGRVTDSTGAPLTGIQVFADDTFFYNANVYGASDENGYYRIELKDLIATSWRVGAYIDVVYEGANLKLPLHPDNAAAFAGSNGAVRNLTWRMSGVDPTGGFYGGEVWVYEGLEAVDFIPDMDRVQVTFEPLEPLLDGSQGETVTALLAGSRIEDVPLTTYQVTARYLPEDGSPIDLLIRSRDVGSYEPSVETGFAVSGSGSVITMELEVRLP